MQLDPSTFIAPIIGGLIIGAVSVAMLLFNGRVTGISSILSGVLVPRSAQFTWKTLFVVGMLLGGVALLFAAPDAFPTGLPRSLPMTAVSGLLVGFGTRLGGGCTSGHGVCGIGRFSGRSIVATLTFILTGAITVFFVRVLGS